MPVTNPWTNPNTYWMYSRRDRPKPGRIKVRPKRSKEQDMTNIQIKHTIEFEGFANELTVGVLRDLVKALEGIDQSKVIELSVTDVPMTSNHTTRRIKIKVEES